MFNGESDVILFHTYGRDADASVDLHGGSDAISFSTYEASDFESEMDIDQMHTGLNLWNSDDQGGEEALRER